MAPRSITSFNHVTADGTTRTVTLTTPALQGNRLVVGCVGGAIATVRLNNSSGTVFDRRTASYSGGFQDPSIHDIIVPSGGATAVHITLNGADQESGAIFELPDGGAFVGASKGPNGGITVDNTVDYQAGSSSAVTASGACTVIAFWALAATTSEQNYSNVANRWRQMEPSGVIYAEGGNQPGSGTEFIWAAGIADAGAGDHKGISAFVGSGGRLAYTTVAVYANSGAAINPTTNPVTVENRRPGTRRQAWFVDGISSGWNGTIAGYTDKTSYTPGQTVNFKVDSNNQAFTTKVFRLGHYGHEEMGARLAATIAGSPAVQSAPSVDGTLGHTTCAWSTTATWAIPSDAVPGVYFYQVTRDDNALNMSTGHFVVKPSSVAGKAVVVVPDATYQAYNIWGARTDNGPRSSGGTWTGRSLYQIGGDLATSNFAHRAYAVSWNRPMASGRTQANTYMFDADYPMWMFLEAQGYDVTYISDTDLEGNNTLLNSASLVIPIGHHEYVSQDMWDAYNNAINAGVNFLWHSSNTALWRTRYIDSGRTMVCYKDSGSIDVSPGFDSGTGRDPVTWTGTWRDSRVSNPSFRPEQTLTGQMFVANAPAAKDLLVPFASKTKPMWRNSASIQALTTGQSYTTPTSVYGDEGDFVDSRFTVQANQVQLCPTVVSISAGSNLNGTVYSTAYSNITIGFTLHRVSSGALVFNTGSWRGAEGVSRWARNAYGTIVGTPNTNWQNAFNALLFDLGALPATVRPLLPTDTALTDPATGAPTGSRDAIAGAYGLTVPPPDAPSVISLCTGGVKPDRFKGAAHTANATTARMAVSLASNMASPTFGSSVSVGTRGHVVVDSPTGLTPNTTYYWTVELDGTVQSTIGTARTFGTALAPASFSFAAGANAATGSNHSVFSSIRTRTGTTGKPASFYACLGELHQGPSASTLTANYQAFETVFGQAEQAQLYRDVPMVYTPSDLDFGGTKADKDHANAASFQAAYRGTFPSYTPEVSDGIYHSFAIGRVLFIVTDQRSFRSNYAATDNSSKTVLGATQKAWLKTQLVDSNYPLKVILGDSEWNNPTTTSGDDTWSAYNTERLELGAYIQANNVRCMYIGGPSVLAAESGLNNLWGYFPLVAVAPLDATSSVGTGTWSQGVYPSSSAASHLYGWFDVVDNIDTISVAYTGYDSDGAPHVTMSTTYNLTSASQFIGWGIPV